MTLSEAMARLEGLGTDSMKQWLLKNGAGENVFGVKNGDIRVVAKEIKIDLALARELWATGNLEARFLATLIVKPKDLSAEELEAMLKTVTYGHLADWLLSYVVKLHPEKEALRRKWMDAKDPALSRGAWSLTTERVSKSPDGLDLPGLLDRIEREMADAPELAKWTMNFCLLEIGVNHEAYRERAIAIGEKIGAYRDYPTSKGCISPFAPIAIRELAARKG